MLRIIILVTLLTAFAVPLLNWAKEYWDDKSAKMKVMEDTAKKTIRYYQGEKK